jgi:hypothetical protein
MADVVSVHVSALNRDFEGKISRFARALDEDTRTMHTEVDVANPGGKIVAGMFADVTLTLVKKGSVLAVPIQAVTRNGTEASVLVVDPRGRIEERKVKLGIEGANDVEVVSGLSPKEQVVIGSRSTSLQLILQLLLTERDISLFGLVYNRRYHGIAEHLAEVCTVQEVRGHSALWVEDNAERSAPESTRGQPIK